MATYLQPIETDILNLPSNQEFTVRMKRVASYGDQLAAQSAMLQVDQGVTGTITKMEWAAYVKALTVRLIVEWNLSDENGGPLPISAASLDRLRSEDGDYLAAEAQKRLKIRKPEQELPFVTPSTNS